MCGDHSMSDMIDIQVKAPSCPKEHQRPVSKTAVAPGVLGEAHLGF